MASSCWIRAALLAISVAACQAGATRFAAAPVRAARTGSIGPRAAGATIDGRATADGQAEDARAAQPDLHRLADLLAEHRLTELSLAASDLDVCGRAQDGEAWTITAVAEHGGGASCLVRESGATCVDRTERDLDRATRRICRGAERRVPAPAWLQGVAELVRSQRDLLHDVRPVASPAGMPALQVRSAGVIGSAHHLLVEVRGRWWLAPEPLVDGRGRGIRRVLDASALGSGAVLLAVAEFYDGGSELGGGETWLQVYCDGGDGLAGCARKRIGLFRWALAADQRDRYPRAAYDLRARPHIEAELEASVTREGLLQLALAYRMLPADRSGWRDESCLADDADAEEDADQDADEDADEDREQMCNPVAVIERLVDDAGLWRLEAGRFVFARR